MMKVGHSEKSGSVRWLKAVWGRRPPPRSASGALLGPKPTQSLRPQATVSDHFVGSSGFEISAVRRFSCYAAINKARSRTALFETRIPPFEREGAGTVPTLRVDCSWSGAARKRGKARNTKVERRTRLQAR